MKVMNYYGKYSMSKKAVDIELIKIEPILYSAANPLDSQIPPMPLPNAHSFGGSSGLDLAFSNQMTLSQTPGLDYNFTQQTYM